MAQYLGLVSVLVPDYDEAIAYYTQSLGFTLKEDTQMGAGKRWVVVSPPGAKETGLLLAKASGGAQEAVIGMQTGGRVFLFLHTDDFYRDYNHMKSMGVQFTEEPREEEYGTVVVFKDIYGNKWDFIMRRVT
ncbi:MAG: VOC family protein [Bacteroidota bacterium]